MNYTGIEPSGTTTYKFSKLSILASGELTMLPSKS
jgi:hypothetical protein